MHSEYFQNGVVRDEKINRFIFPKRNHRKAEVPSNKENMIVHPRHVDVLRYPLTFANYNTFTTTLWRGFITHQLRRIHYTAACVEYPPVNENRWSCCVQELSSIRTLAAVSTDRCWSAASFWPLISNSLINQHLPTVCDAFTYQDKVTYKWISTHLRPSTTK